VRVERHHEIACRERHRVFFSGAHPAGPALDNVEARQAVIGRPEAPRTREFHPAEDTPLEVERPDHVGQHVRPGQLGQDSHLDPLPE
jgi:hypothetical protein